MPAGCLAFFKQDLDQNRLKGSVFIMRKITVVGAGGTGCCTAAELTLMGNRVTLCEQEGWCEENLAAIRTRGQGHAACCCHCCSGLYF